MRLRHGGLLGAAAALCAALATLFASSASAYVPPPEEDPFYRYEGTTPLAQIPPGTVLKSREFSGYHIAGVTTPFRVVQILYRTLGELEEPQVNVTTVLIPPIIAPGHPVVSYQSFYDSLNPREDPSYQIALEASEGSTLKTPSAEQVFIAPYLLAGDTVVVSDIEGEEADFAAGPLYGFNTIFGLQAALNDGSQTGLSETNKIALIGYSGGAIGTGWAVELAPAYAPAVNARLVGASFGGILVDPIHNLHYMEGSEEWSGVVPMGLIGLSRAFHVNPYPYLNPYGVELFNRLQKAGIGEAEGHYPGLTWSQFAKRRYPAIEYVPKLVEIANQLIMGTRGTPTVPLLMVQGAGGEQEGTPGYKPGIGPGDGVMIAGDVRTLAREYCERGVKVTYREHEKLDHVETGVVWAVETLPWVQARFLGLPAGEDCSEIPPGNSLAPAQPLSLEEEPPAGSGSQAAASGGKQSADPAVRTDKAGAGRGKAGKRAKHAARRATHRRHARRRHRERLAVKRGRSRAGALRARRR